MRDPNAGVRNNAAGALGFFRNQTKVVVPVLVKGLADPDASVRLQSAHSLDRVDPSAAASAGVVSVIIGCLQGPDVHGSYRDAARLLSEMHKEPALAIPALAASLESLDSRVRIESANALGEFGAEAKVAIPNLVKALEDKDASVRTAATNALKLVDATVARKAGVVFE